MIKRGTRCSNMNHCRVDAPVRYCPTCGEVVNVNVALEACAEEKHAIWRRRGSTFCVDCGKRLIMTT